MALRIHVLEYFEATAQAQPARIAVSDGASSLTFAELRDQAQALALHIEDVTGAGLRPVALLMSKSVAWIVGVLATLYAGKIYAPLDSRTPTARLSLVLTGLNAAAVIVDEKNHAAALAAGVPEERVVKIGTCEPGKQREPTGWKNLIDTDPAYIIHTSGSTGLPKGVVISHRGIIDYLEWALDTYQVNSAAIIGNQAPYYFDNSTLDFYLCFATGAQLVLIPDDLFSFPVRLMQFMIDHSVSFIFWVPSVLVNIANMKLLELPKQPPLTKILFAGEVMPNRQLNQWRRAFPGALFSNLYGPTEITVDCTYFIVNRPFADEEPLPIGFPCRNSGVLILDGDRQVSKAGEIGELCVRGSSLACGYWNDPQKTADKFVQNPLNPSYPERIYRTGDLVSYNDRGEILFHGRADSQIKHQGFRIELGEIENACLAVPGIRNACVLYRQAEKQIVLIYEADQDVLPPAIRIELAKMLPKYMLPMSFQRLDALPLNPNGKIDRKRMQDSLKPEQP